MSLHVLRPKINVFYYVPSAKLWRKKQDCSPTKAEMESFRTITYGFLLLNYYTGS